jgi:hypothetical protein
MDCLDERGVAREGLQRSGLILPEERRYRVLLPIQSGVLAPRECVVEVSSDAPIKRQIDPRGQCTGCLRSRLIAAMLDLWVGD